MLSRVMSSSRVLVSQTYTAYYEREETLNELLNIYTSNCRQVYGGFNDVKTQIGFPSDNGKPVSHHLTCVHYRHRYVLPSHHRKVGHLGS